MPLCSARIRTLHDTVACSQRAVAAADDAAAADETAGAARQRCSFETSSEIITTHIKTDARFTQISME
jgi:hypothetical protein